MITHRNAISIFLSYAHEDEPLLRQLETHLSLLKRQGLISTWYDRQIAPGTDWAKVIDERLELASIILLLVSPDFLASDYCYQVEMKRALERHEADQACVIPVALRPADWKGAPFAHLQALPTDAKAITTWRNRDKALVNVAAGIRRTIENLPLLQASMSRADLPAFWNIPYPRNPFFVGREEMLSFVHAHFQTGQPMALSQHPQAISGLGGIGKTQTAVEYAYRFGKEYQAVFWAYAESRETLVSSYVALAVLLNLPEQDVQEHTITVQAVKRWLQTHSAWLLILDNADELALAQEFLPPVPGGHLLLTTRAQATGRLANRLEVEAFSAEQSTLFLLRRAGLLAHDASLEQALLDDREQALQIAKALGGLPLALDQAGAYLEETGCSLSEYQQLYQQYRADLLRERRGLLADHPEPVATTWSISFRRVEEKNPTAAELLRFCAFLSPDAIPEEVLTAGTSLLGPVLASAAGDVFRLNQAIEALRAYSLVQRDPKGKTLSIHRLVQVVLQDAMEEAERRSWAERVILSINVAFPRSDYDTWPQCERLLSQAWSAKKFIEQYQIISEEAEQLLNKMADYLWDRGRYAEAEPLYQQLLRISEPHLGSEHPKVAWALHGLGDLYWRQGKYIEAEPLLLRAIQIMEQKFGPEDLRVAHMLFGLATLYRHQGKDAQSERLYQREIQIVEQQLGPESPELVTPLSNLAVLYHHPDKYAEAEQLYQRALQISMQQLVPEPEKALALLGLAKLYHEQGKHAEAELLYQQTLRIWEQYFPEHRMVSQPLSGLRRLYLNQGRYTEVEPICQRELRIWEQAVTFNPTDAAAYLHRGYIYLYLNKKEEACADFARYASLQPTDVGAAWMVVFTSLSKQRPGVEIAERLEAIALLDPEDHEAYICRGVALGLRNKPEEGLTELEHALSLDAENEDALFWKGMMCAYLGRSTTAIKSIEQALQAGLPPILLIPLFWLEQESPHFYRKNAEPLLKRNHLL
jgi:tetratricopeptide (TPR) repeat protein